MSDNTNEDIPDVNHFAVDIGIIGTTVRTYVLQTYFMITFYILLAAKLWAPYDLHWVIVALPLVISPLGVGVISMCATAIVGFIVQIISDIRNRRW
jgi:ABC-type molybdate transport system permease subunit